MTQNTLIIAAALALASPLAGAQAVWRCGNSYSQQPCQGARAIDSPAAPPTPAEAARASQAARTDAKLAAELEKARLQRERNAPRAIVIGPKETPAAETRPAKDGTRPKAGKLEQFTAVAPGTGGKKKKTR